MIDASESKTPDVSGKNISASARLTALCAFWLFTFFLTPLPGDNVNTRIDLTSAIVRYNSLKIDSYHLNTMDKAYVNGHYYSDKAPGISFMALPAAWIYNFSRPVSPDDRMFILLMTAFAVSLPAALLVFPLFSLTARSSASPPSAFLLIVSLLFGTLFLPYSTLFYGHVTGAAISFLVFYIACISKSSPPLKMLVAGLLCSWLVMVEYPLAVHSIILTLLLLSTRENRGSIPALIPGIAVCAALFFWYNKTAYGNWFTLGYFHESWGEFQEGHRRGFVGLTHPSPSAIYEILFRPGMGLFFLSPFLLFAVPGFFSALRYKEWRLPALAAGSISVIGILVNASHFIPMGGMAPGPRHLVTILPYLVFLCSFFLRSRSATRIGIFSGLTAVSVLSHLLITVTDPQAPVGFDVPSCEYSLNHALHGIFRPPWLSSVSSLPAFACLILFAITALLLLFMAYSALRGGAGNRIPCTFLAGVIAAAVSLSAWWAACSYYSHKEVVKKKYFLAFSYRLTGRDELAEAGYKEVLRLHPKHALANFSLGKMAMDNMDLVSAKKYFLATVEVYPTLSEAQYNLANICMVDGEYEEAFQRYAISIDTERMGNTRQLARSYAGMASILASRGRPDEALMYFRKAEGLSPGDPFLNGAQEAIGKSRTAQEGRTGD